MKTIVTHIGPDLDAITSVWLIKTFIPGWKEAVLAFVPAGNTLEGKPTESNDDVIHVDTGFGKFDHHQTNEDTCAALLVYGEVKRRKGSADPALERLLRVVNDTDHFREAFYPNPTADFWDFSLASQIDGWRLIHADNPMMVVEYGMRALDGIYKTFQNKIWAEKELKEKGRKFNTRWGESIGVVTTNDEVVHLGQKMGYAIVVRKDPKKGYLRIKALPKDGIDLESVYKVLLEDEPHATWFLHASHHMVLNGSSKNPSMRPTKKTLDEIIAVIKKQSGL